jgi:outer membrane protein OmpA-like peptidoglycan-associated protein
MRSSKTTIESITLALVLLISVAVFGQDSKTSGQSQDKSDTIQAGTAVDGQKLKIEGIVVNRNADMITLRGLDGKETQVVLTERTKIKTDHKGWFRRGQDSGASYILRGLRLKAEGKGNSDGQLVAEKIRFDEQDLRTAQALESRVDPVETLANSTEALAQSNQTRITDAEQNAQRLSGQVEELNGVAYAAGTLAANAQRSADQAQADADTANQRISGLDDYEVYKTLSVHFKPGSARLSPEAKAEIDDAATSVQGENLNGWIVAVTGYADSTGATATNRSLSELRAKAVINYLVTKYDLPLRRIVQPYGYGSLDPIAENDTRAGRAMNRRVEIKVLINKGISSQASTEQTSNNEQ